MTVLGWILVQVPWSFPSKWHGNRLVFLCCSPLNVRRLLASIWWRQLDNRSLWQLSDTRVCINKVTQLTCVHTYSADSWCEVHPTILHEGPWSISNHVLYVIILTICTCTKQVASVNTLAAWFQNKAMCYCDTQIHVMMLTKPMVFHLNYFS